MENKIIVRLPTRNLKHVEEFMKTMNENEIVVIPDDIPLLVKQTNGYWVEIKNKPKINFKL